MLMQLYLQFQHLHYYYTNLYAYNILADTYTTIKDYYYVRRRN